MKAILAIKTKFCSKWFFIHILVLCMIHISCMHALTIIVIISDFPKLSETFVLNQITGLIDRGHDVYIFATKLLDPEKAHPDVHKYCLLDKTYVDLEDKRRLLTTVGCDVLYGHFGQNGLKGMRLIDRFKLDAKLVTVFHGFDMSKLLLSDPSVYQNLFEKLDLALPVSQYWRDKLISLGLDPHKIIVHHMGIDCDKFNVQDRPFYRNRKIRILSIARLVEKKGIEYGIRAIAQLIRHGNDVSYTVIGYGPLKTDLKALIKELGIEDYVRFIGLKKQDRVIQYLRNADILLVPSVTALDGNQEGIPVVMMEAMSMGLPVVGTRHSGAPELITDGVSGFLVPERDADSLADRLEYLIERPDLRVKMGQAGRSYVKKYFNIDKLNNDLVDILSSM